MVHSDLYRHCPVQSRAVKAAILPVFHKVGGGHRILQPAIEVKQIFIVVGIKAQNDIIPVAVGLGNKEVAAAGGAIGQTVFPGIPASHGIGKGKAGAIPDIPVLVGDNAGVVDVGEVVGADGEGNGGIGQIFMTEVDVAAFGEGSAITEVSGFRDLDIRSLNTQFMTFGILEILFERKIVFRLVVDGSGQAVFIIDMHQ